MWLCLVQLYTSGSTGKPKGVEHTLAGYMVGASTTFKYVFDHRPDDIYWCTADCGWITGHSYVAYGTTRPQPVAMGSLCCLLIRVSKRVPHMASVSQPDFQGLRSC